MNHITNKYKKSIPFSMNLFFSLIVLSFIPFIDTLVRTNLITNIPQTDGLGIAGHMECRPHVLQFDCISNDIRPYC